MVTIGNGIEVSDETYEAMKKCAEMVGRAGFTRKELGRRLRKIASESSMSLKDVTNEVVSQAASKALWKGGEKMEGKRVIEPETTVRDLMRWAGEGFVEALCEAIRIRIERRDEYGDSYEDDELTFLYYQMRNKLKRIKLQISMDDGVESVNPHATKTIEDSLKDLICYASFALNNVEAGRYGT